MTPAARKRVDAIDFARLPTMALVIGVHSFTLLPLTATLGAFIIVFHVSREVFFLLTAFVLMVSYGRGRVRWRAFLRRRYLFVAVPYVAWSAIYFIVYNHAFDTVWSALSLFGHDLLVGGADYHLYFLLVSMQIYVLFPFIRWFIRVTDGHHRLVLGAAAVFQLAFAETQQVGWRPGGLITAWLNGPDAVLPSYVLYVVAGSVAAWHAESLMQWTREHLRRVASVSLAAIAAGVAVYVIQSWSGTAPAAASTVFQPVVVVESIAVAWSFLAAGLVWTARGAPMRRGVTAVADASFGIYLVHPLVIAGLAEGAILAGLQITTLSAPAAVVLPILLVGVIPFVYVASGLLVGGARRLPVSLPLTGRPRLRAQVPVADPVTELPPAARARRQMHAAHTIASAQVAESA